MTPAIPAPEPTTDDSKGTRIMTPEEYAKHVKVPVAVVKKMLCESGRTANKFDPRDVDRRFGQKNVRLIVSNTTAAGFVRPRVIARKAQA